MTDTWQDIPTSDRPKCHPSTEALEIGKLRERVAELEAALSWYAERLSEFSRATDQSADDAEELLDRDGGKIARAALRRAPQRDEGKTGGNGS